MDRTEFGRRIILFFLLFVLGGVFLLNAEPAALTPSCNLSFSCPSSTPTSPAVVSGKLSNAYCIVTGTKISVGSCIDSSASIAVLALIVSFLMVAVSYMIGEVIKIDEFKGWYKGELWETAKSVLLIVIIYSLLVEIGGVANALTGGGALPAAPSGSAGLSSTLSTLYSNVQNDYISPELNNVAYPAYYGILGVAVGLDYIKSFVLYINIPIPILPIPGAVAGALATGVEENVFFSNVLISGKSYSFVNQAFDFITVPLLILFQFLNDVMVPLLVTSLSVLLPIGIIFRSMPFLRPIGGMLIAFAIAISIVFPTLLLAVNMPIQNFMAGILTPPAAPSSVTIPAAPLECTLLQSMINFATPLCLFVNPSTINFASGFVIGMFGPMTGIFTVYNAILGWILPLVIQFILLIIDLIITIVIGQQISTMLGGRKMTLGIGKLSLI
ncbi:MAG: hypothetical protein M1331_01015 [Candidatus Marsarchaeota archaeon]|nr:hypothetical protein [Candidatus Marsarchaeota archaeon]MCL5105964.1 hypothetical protein [Candidatus Marsarchaeota archaeon]